MMKRALLLSTCVFWSGLASGFPAEVPVSLELVTEPGFPVEGQQQWIQFLQARELSLSHVRIRSAQGHEEPGIENRGSDDAPRYVVTGVLTQGGRLALPGLQIRHGQRKELAQWLDRLRSGGNELVTAQTGAFGLTAKQFAMLQAALKKRVAVSTKGRPVGEIAGYLEQTMAVDVEWDAGARPVRSSQDEIPDELEGISCGTALAAIVRPHGLLVKPAGQGTRLVSLRVTRDAQLSEAWPIGTRPEKGAADVAPALLKSINVEIVNQPLDKTLATIEQRLAIPFLFDHNLLARDEADLSELVSMPPRRTFYKKILDELLFQKMLICELRIDDAGTAFLWITSAKR